MNKSTPILVTGATGLLGSYIVRTLLQQGYHHIVASKRPSSNLDYIADFKENVQWVNLDFLDIDTLYAVVQKIQYVIHAAASVNFKQSALNGSLSNSEITARLVDACLSTKIERFIFVSSIAALGRTAVENHLDEDAVWEDSEYNSRYAISKYQSELEVWRAQAEGLSTIILNPSFILGTGDWNKSSLQLVKKVANGTRFLPPGINGFVDVRDVAQAVRLAMESSITSRRFIVSEGNYSYKFIATNLAKEMGVSVSHSTLTSGAIRWAEKFLQPLSKWLPWRSIPSGEMLRNLRCKSYYNNSRSIDELGVDYRPISESIKDVGQSFLSQDIMVLPL